MPEDLLAQVGSVRIGVLQNRVDEGAERRPTGSPAIGDGSDSSGTAAAGATEEPRSSSSLLRTSGSLVTPATGAASAAWLSAEYDVRRQVASTSRPKTRTSSGGAGRGCHE